jgi:phosphate acetyltransferase
MMAAMTPGVYVAGTEPATGKSAIALGVQQLLARRVQRLGVFRPVVADRERDPLIDLLLPEFLPYEAACGVGYEEVRADEARALEGAVDEALRTAPTPDLGGSATTEAFTDAVLAALPV